MKTGLTRLFFKLPVLNFDLARVLDLLTLDILEATPVGRPGFDPRPGRCVVSLSKRHFLPKSTGNTQE